MKMICMNIEFGFLELEQENDAPEVAVARLFASVKKSGAEYNYGHFTHCLQQLPSERETQVFIIFLCIYILFASNTYGYIYIYIYVIRQQPLKSKLCWFLVKK